MAYRLSPAESFAALATDGAGVSVLVPGCSRILEKNIAKCNSSLAA